MTPRYTAWGFVTRTKEGRQELLIATRAKKDDPLREGEFVLPGGSLEGSEGYVDAAIREVHQETGIKTRYMHEAPLRLRQQSFAKHHLTGKVERGIIQLTYTDNGKSYSGMLIPLAPQPSEQEPLEQEGSDARAPRYVALQEAFSQQERFTSACQVLLNIIREHA